MSNVLNKVLRPDTNGDNIYDLQGTVRLGKPVELGIKTGITAHAGGGQANGVLLTKEFNDITICASDFDSVRLPSAITGIPCIVKNSSSHILSVFPFLADSINAMAVNLSIDVPAGAIMEFRAKNEIVWETPESMYLSAPTTQKGGIVYKSADNAGNSLTEIINASQTGDRVYSIPDAGGNSNFSMEAIDISDYVKFLGIQDVINFDIATGTWTTVRVAQGDYVKQKTATDETAILGIDITEILRTTASKGLKLASFDVIFRNITADLDAHSVTLDKIGYTDSAVVTTTNIALTGTLGIGQDNDPQIDSVTIDTPAYNVTDNSKYVIELTVDAAATSVYDFIGVMLKFTRNDK